MTFQAEPLPALPMTLAQAIARMEGWYAQGKVPNRPQRNLNPGDLNFGTFAAKFGATNGDPRFAVFPSADAGWAALEALLKSPLYVGLTLEEAINRFAPPSENETHVYVQFVTRWTGRQATDVLEAA